MSFQSLDPVSVIAEALTAGKCKLFLPHYFNFEGYPVEIITHSGDRAKDCRVLYARKGSAFKSIMIRQT